MPVEDAGLVKGTLDLLVLKALSFGPRHGYAVARFIRSSSAERLVVEDRALYLSLHRLEERGQVIGEWGVSENQRRAKYYSLTPLGERQLRQEATHWRDYADAVSAVLASVGAA